MICFASSLIFISLLCTPCMSVSVPEYIYPVACVKQDKEKYLYLIHQTAHDQLDLLRWNVRTKEAQKVLLCRFTPAGLQMLPGGNGFSFIDHDTLRVKMHHKRSPQLIDFDEPLYDLTVISWIDDATCYFSACYNGQHGIYQASMQGHCDCIVASTECDCLYPQKIEDQLFYIERDNEAGYKILCTSYPKLSYVPQDPLRYLQQQRKTKKVQKKYRATPKEIIIELNNKNIAFLHMVNEHEGYFIEHPPTVDKHDKVIRFSYHWIYCVNDAWHDTVLFDFSVPAHFLLQKEERLYESMLPLLPRHVPGLGIVFVDTGNDLGSLDVWLHIDVSNKILLSSYLETQAHFGVFVDGDTVYYGGIVTHEEDALPNMWLQQGMLCVNLPCSRVC